MSDGVLLLLFLAALPAGWLIARLLVRAVPGAAGPAAAWRERERGLSPADRRKVRRAVDRGRAVDDPALREHAVAYASSRQQLLGAGRRAVPVLAVVAAVELGLAAWLGVGAGNWAAALSLAGLLLLVVLVLTVAGRRRPGVLRRAVEANGGR